MTTLYPIQQPPNIPSTSGIYKITCLTTGKFYIGSAVNLKRRWQNHLRTLRLNIHRNIKLQRAFNKYGPNTFVFEAIELVLVPFLLEREQYWIDKTQAVEKGFNLALIAGSRMGMKNSPEHIEKLRQANLGKKASPETIKKLRTSHLGNPGYWTGKKHNPETVEKMRLAKSVNPGGRTPGFEVPPETRGKIRQSLTGYKHTEEAKRNMGDSHRGKPRSEESVKKSSIARTGRKNTPESIAGMVNAKTKWMKTIIMTDPNGVEHTITGIKQFCREHSLDYSTILKVLKGIYPTHKGWKARYPEQ